MGVCHAYLPSLLACLEVQISTTLSSCCGVQVGEGGSLYCPALFAPPLTVGGETQIFPLWLLEEIVAAAEVAVDAEEGS